MLSDKNTIAKLIRKLFFHKNGSRIFYGIGRYVADTTAKIALRQFSCYINHKRIHMTKIEHFHKTNLHPLGNYIFSK